MKLADLYAEFPRGDVIWRPQGSVSKNGTILALAYIDARDVMDRLDKVCGAENWQDSYHETPKGRVICTLSIRVGGEWISKSDGAGASDIEGEKGAISDALKRAAVKWGIGRYLYDLDSPWVRCETFAGNDGKPRFKRFSEDPWTKVRRAPRVFEVASDEAPAPKDQPKKEEPAKVLTKAEGETIIAALAALTEWRAVDDYEQKLAEGPMAHALKHPKIEKALADRRAAISAADPIILGDQRAGETPFDDFPGDRVRA